MIHGERHGDDMLLYTENKEGNNSHSINYKGKLIAIETILLSIFHGNFMLTTTVMSLRLKGQLYDSCVKK